MKLDVRGFLEKSIKDYCQLNSIDDIDGFSKRCLQQGFNIVKFGTSPLDNIKREQNGIIDIEKPKKIKNEKPSRKETREFVETKETTNSEQKEKITTVEKTETKKPVIVRKIQVIKKA